MRRFKYFRTLKIWWQFIIFTYTLLLVPHFSTPHVFKPNAAIMNIFVAKLNFKTRKEELETAFAKFGQVSSAKIVRDKDTGRSKGFGFVEMPNDDEGNAAIEGLNEKELDGRVIVVKPANPKSPA
jgi:RNA recognition motif-containing protein